MDIKLRARLSAYSKVETFDKSSDQDPSEPCCNMKPISKEAIDELFNTSGNENAPVIPEVDSKYNFIDSLF